MDWFVFPQIKNGPAYIQVSCVNVQELPKLATMKTKN